MRWYKWGIISKVVLFRYSILRNITKLRGVMVRMLPRFYKILCTYFFLDATGEDRADTNPKTG